MTDRTAEELAQDFTVIMKAKTDWGGESMTATDSAISAGNGYTAA